MPSAGSSRMLKRESSSKTTASRIQTSSITAQNCSSVIAMTHAFGVFVDPTFNWEGNVEMQVITSVFTEIPGAGPHGVGPGSIMKVPRPIGFLFATLVVSMTYFQSSLNETTGKISWITFLSIKALLHGITNGG